MLPARYEPFGLSVLEAALSGCALVLGDIASLREVWQDAALYVPPDDAGALTAALARLIAEPELRHSLATSARKRAEQALKEKIDLDPGEVERLEGVVRFAIAQLSVKSRRR